MEKEIYILLGALVGFIAAALTSGIQLKIAKQNSQKDIQLQTGRLADERLKNEVALQREKLEKLHKLLSTISFENSQTMSFLHREELNISDFRKRYIENCDRIHDAHAITDLYYPDMSDFVDEIFKHANLFWGYQDIVMQTEVPVSQQLILTNLAEVRSAGLEIKTLVVALQNQIAEKGKALEKKMQ
jgi:hypothetical protein